jgi:4-amino-4-deoxy-L-arabinose transferase-like glycosyltransferase
MNSASSFSPRYLGMSPATAAILVIALATVYRFFYATWLPILPDEAYYFQWSKPQHLDASYFSKGPAVAYTIAAGTALWGANNFGVRFFAVLLSAGTAWQMFLLARRWYDETTALIAVLITNVVPLYALGAVVMTIDPLSAFFWIWAANLFSKAVREGRTRDWILTGFAVGSGFLAKYLNALELISFLAFLLIVPAHRQLLRRPHFWLMLAVAVLSTTPVWWWNWKHGWVSAGQLASRGHLDGPFEVHISTFWNFLGLQALVISPWLFLALISTALVAIITHWRLKGRAGSEGELLLLLLFLPVFLMYAVLSWHLRCEPNWPAVSYLTLIIIMASLWKRMIAARAGGRSFIIFAFVFAWLQTLIMHDPEILHLPQKYDPMSRVVGWSDIAAHLQTLREQQQADVLIADAYKEASVFSFHLPDQAFIYTLRHEPPSNQFDFWPGYKSVSPHRAIWITSERDTSGVSADFNTITPLEKVLISFHGQPLREYTIYQCENH